MSKKKGRNVESRFALNPTNLDMSRSRFDRNHSVKLSFNVGDLIPFFVDEVLPGDTFNVKTSKVVRMQPLVTPIMDNIYLDTYYFFVPNRLTWKHWREFCGENTESAWIPTTEYSIPQVTAPTDGWDVGTLADYMGIPPKVGDISVNALPFRAYALICNEWFRDQNLIDPILNTDGDATITGSNDVIDIDGDDIRNNNLYKGGYPFRVAKYHDYFTSCLPSPQKGPDVMIPVAEGGNYPVYPTSDRHAVEDYPSNIRPIAWNRSDGNEVGADMYSRLGSTSSNDWTNTSMYLQTNAPASNNMLTPTNLWAMSSGNAQAATINQLRLAFQIQKMYERDARGGTRYIELLKSHFGVTSPDARLQRPEYLGGNRIPVSISQVTQNSATGSGATPQGTVTGMSLSTDSDRSFTKSFVEHGYVIGVMVARYPHTYQQGLERLWSRKSRFDFYWPVFANIGEQAVLNKEIYLQGSSTVNTETGEPIDNEVFGYQEAWADYRYKLSRVAGEMRSVADLSLDIWHLADDYASQPYLSPSWIAEDGGDVDRVLAVSSSVSNQLFADIYITNRTTRVMPMYSIPGLIDHH